MTDSPTPCAHEFPPILAAADGGAGGWTATCRTGCGFRCGSYDPDIAVPEHWKPFIPMLAGAPSEPEPEPVRDDVLLLLRAVNRLANDTDGDTQAPLLAYDGGSRRAAISLAEKMRDRFCDLTLAAVNDLGRPVFEAMNATAIASDMLSLAMVSPNPDRYEYTVALQTLRSLLAKHTITSGVASVESRLLIALGEVGW